MPETGSSPLVAEQAYLDRAREQLARMRALTLSLSIQAGDRVSGEYLAATLHRRAASLIDDPATTLFFGRTDHDDGRCWYVGRRHVADAEGEAMVVDWRADISRAFYRAGNPDRMGVLRRRRFGAEGGRLTAYEDEHLGVSSLTSTAQHSAILAREIERPRVGPMRDIVATIQPEQDEIVRADVLTSVCVQGAPGTGKTAVGLHRAAWLLYAHGDRLSRSGVLVIGPNAAFLEHVAAVLPSLGEVQVRHTTIDALVQPRPTGRSTGQRVRSTRSRAPASEPVERACLKGQARLAEVLRRAVWSHVGAPAEALVLPRGARRWRIPAYTVAEVAEELTRRGVRYAAGREMLPRRLAHLVLTLIEAAGDSPDDRVQDQVARSREVRRCVDQVWPALKPATVLFRLLSDPVFLARCADGVLTEAEQALLIWDPLPRGPGSARWSAADAVLLDELADQVQRTPSLGHIVLDEAQDLSPMQLRAVGRRCSTGSLTVLGDIAQGTTPWSTPSWPESLAHLGHPEAVVEVLDRGFRVPSAVIDFAARLLPSIAEGLPPPVSVREDPGTLTVHAAPDPEQVWPATLEAVRRALAEPGSVGVIVTEGRVAQAAAALSAAGIDHLVAGGADQSADGTAEALLDAALGDDETPLPRITVVPARTAKGLEYDQVVVVEPAEIAAAEPDERTGLRRLYVVLTRAVSGLAVVHHHPLPSSLSMA